jgi:hypothetical protein
MVEIVRDNRDRTIIGKALSRPFQHGRGKVNTDRFRPRMMPLSKREQAAIAGAKIENAAHLGWPKFQQRRFSFAAVWD